jgi:hypothetical protein
MYDFLTIQLTGNKMYLTITNQETINSLAINIVYREREVHQYQINIDNYTQMLAVLPQGEPTAEIAQYLNTKTEDLPSSLALELVLAITDYQYRDRISFLIRTETIEQSKSKRILEAMKSQIPADQLGALVSEALATINAQAVPSA